MENKDPKILIKKFYDGKTSIQEELFLYDYFMNNDIPTDLEKDKKLFINLHKIEDEVAIPLNLKQDLIQLIDRLDEKNKKTKKINLKWSIGIAASMMIVISCSIYMFSERETNRPLVDTYSDPTEAYAATQKALFLASNRLNKGFNQLQDAQNSLDKTNKILNKTFRQ